MGVVTRAPPTWQCALRVAVAMATLAACAPLTLPDPACFSGSDTKACIKIIKPKDAGDLTIAGGDDVQEDTTGAADTPVVDNGGLADAAATTDTKPDTADAAAEVDASPGCTPADICAKTAKGLGAGDRHTCAIAANNTVRCWGDNSFGQCGSAAGTDSIESPTPATLPAGTLLHIASGGFHSCAAMTSGDIACWGRNDDGQLALGKKSKTELPQTQTNLGTGIRSLSAGLGHTCAVDKAGKAWCWGDNSYGQLGDGGTASKDLPVAVGGGLAWKEVAAGKYFTCGRDDKGAILCWGENAKGQLGGTPGEQHAPVQVKGLPGPASALAVGAQHACAVLVNDGSVWCWGANEDGQLGFGDLSGKLSAVKAKTPLGAVTAIACGAAHSCALMEDDTALCWGDGSHGQLATSGSVKSASPIEVSGLPKLLTQLSAGAWHTCAMTKNGGLVCWGDSANGQLGNGLATAKLDPVVLPLVGAAFLTAGAYHTCAGSKTTDLNCWGDNGFQQGGNPAPVVQWTPTSSALVPLGIQSLHGGGYHNCGWYGAGMLKCWGDNNDGQLGAAGKGSSPTPFSIVGLPVKATTAGAIVATGHRHSCALVPGDHLLCWGNNDFGQLGTGTKQGSSAPSPVAGVLANTFKFVAANGDRTCALTLPGEIWCWGENGDGALNGSTDATVLKPAPAQAGIGWKGLWLGREHTCAQAGDGAIHCWGQNSHGQVGVAAGIVAAKTVAVAGLSEPTVAMALGWYHSCALSTKGTLRCWGGNDKGQLGDGTSKSRHTPGNVVGLVGNTTAVTAGYMHTCALAAGGKTLCWGSNSLGQVGSGTQSVAVVVSGFGP